MALVYSRNIILDISTRWGGSSKTTPSTSPVYATSCTTHILQSVVATYIAGHRPNQPSQAFNSSLTPGTIVMTIMASVRIDYRVEELLHELQEERSDLLNAVMHDTDQDTMPLWAELARNADTRIELEKILSLRRRNRLRSDDARCQRVVMAFDLRPGKHYGYRLPVKDWPAPWGWSDSDQDVEFRATDWNSRTRCASEPGSWSSTDTWESEAP